MARKRKRAEKSYCSRKVLKLSGEAVREHDSILHSYYEKVLSLREYLLSRLPTNSRVRRRNLKIQDLDNAENILDAYLVGVSREPSRETCRSRQREFQTFTQSPAYSSHRGTDKDQLCSLQEVVDFTLWYLFKACPNVSTRPRHLLCHGLQRSTGPADKDLGHDVRTFLPGIIQTFMNDTIAMLRQGPWLEIFAALGRDGEPIFLSLLLDCGLFQKLPYGQNNHLQLSGIPIYDLYAAQQEPQPPKHNSSGIETLRSLTQIKFVRNRMLYGKPSLNKAGEVKFGLRHIHVLERYATLSNRSETIKVMKYVFPRQFKLHNVFTSPIDAKQTTQPLQDYSYREQELQQCNSLKLPRRLRGQPEQMVRKMRVRHQRCSYTQLLRHYCPLNTTKSLAALRSVCHHNNQTQKSTAPITQITMTNHCELCPDDPRTTENPDFFTYATAASAVSAFCCAVLRKLMPRDLVGTGQEGEQNWRVLHKSVDRFVRIRRYETLSLHEVCQGLKLKTIAWLVPPGGSPSQKIAASEIKKRLEILHELLYYIFDSLLIPLVRSNFYVTESGPHRNHLYYFRHDVWRKLSEPNLATMRLTMYEQLPKSQVSRVMESRTLGYSQVRLLPKAHGTRPITNLRRRMVKVVGGHRILGPSINTQLNPLSCALNFERTQRSELLKSAIFSIGGLHQRLKSFKQEVKNQKLYFVKVDIQSCFDSIPQDELLVMLQQILNHPRYRVAKYVQLKQSGSGRTSKASRSKPRFVSLASPLLLNHASNENPVTSLLQRKNGQILQDTGVQKIWQNHVLFKLAKEHIQSNIVKIGKKHFRQKTGIPQGSVLSSLLCSLFYSEFESECLNFLGKESLLVRLIDDFLLITSNKSTARHFLEIMIQGHAKYGISVNPDKSLVNFEVMVSGCKIPRHPSREAFPYCGVAIDMQTLEITKERQRSDIYVENGLTVDTTQKAGSSFQHKVLRYLKIQLSPMLLDNDLNSLQQIMITFLEAFTETAMKMHQYLKAMSAARRPSQIFVIKVVEELIKVGTRYARSQSPRPIDSTRTAVLSWHQMCWIVSASLEAVLRKKQSQYETVLAWLRQVRRASESHMRMNKVSLQKLLDRSGRSFAEMVY